SARILPKVVPQLPAPTTVTRGPAAGLRLKTTRFTLLVLARVPALGRGLLATELLEQRGHAIHDAVGGFVERAGRAAARCDVRQIDRIAEDHAHPLAGEETDLLRVAAHHLLHAPVRG